MQIKFTVHSCAEQAFEIETTLGERAVKAHVPGLVVELVSADDAMSHTLKLVPEDMAAALEMFAPGGSVSATYEKDEH